MQSPNPYEAKFTSPEPHRIMFIDIRVVLIERMQRQYFRWLWILVSRLTEQLNFQTGSQTATQAFHLSLIISQSTL